MTERLFTATELGDLKLSNRVVMAPMTRSRANDDDSANALMAEYYAQRASAGLIISEGTQPSADGKGYCRTPGIYRPEHIASWQQVTNAVKASAVKTSAVKDSGGQMVMQLMHCGRVGHADNKASDAQTIAPSAIAAKADIYTENGMQAMATPRALETAEIASVIEDYANAAANAMAAGFAGIELHCTSGYLPAQFLSTGTNQRTDQYGGSLNNRLGFVLDVLDAICAKIGSGKVGLRICPGNPFNDLQDDDPVETFSALLEAISPKNLAYLHAIKSPVKNIDVIAMAEKHFSGNVIINDGFDRESAEAILAKPQIKAVSFGRAFIANPDLVARYQQNIRLNDFDASSLYTPGAKGYTDYDVAGNE